MVRTENAAWILSAFVSCCAQTSFITWDIAGRRAVRQVTNNCQGVDSCTAYPTYLNRHDLINQSINSQASSHDFKVAEVTWKRYELSIVLLDTCCTCRPVKPMRPHVLGVHLARE